MTTLEKIAEKVAKLEAAVERLTLWADRFLDLANHTFLRARDFGVRRLAVVSQFRNAIREQGEITLGAYAPTTICERGANIALAQAVNLEPANVTGGAINPGAWRFRYPPDFLSGQPNTEPNGVLHLVETATDFFNSSTKLGMRIGYWGTARIQAGWDNQLVNSQSSFSPLLYVAVPSDFGTGMAYVRASTWWYACDERLKENIQSLKNVAAKVKRLEGKKFRAGEREQIGFTAQSVREVLPEAVTELDDGTLALDTNAILAVLTSAVAELIERVERLENEDNRRTNDLCRAPDQ